jgi:hypothetical protein
MRRNLGRLEVLGVVARTDKALAVRARGAEGARGIFRFVFTPPGKLDGVQVEIGE